LKALAEDESDIIKNIAKETLLKLKA